VRSARDSESRLPSPTEVFFVEEMNEVEAVAEKGRHGASHLISTKTLANADSRKGPTHRGPTVLSKLFPVEPPTRACLRTVGLGALFSCNIEKRERQNNVSALDFAEGILSMPSHSRAINQRGPVR
jgi:hypothetical protein